MSKNPDKTRKGRNQHMNIQKAKEQLYQLLVNRIPGIRERFRQKKQDSAGASKIQSISYLFWLNFSYYVLHQKQLGESLRYPYYETKTLYQNGSESALSGQIRPREMAKKLSAYEVISFDVFDTLIFRPFSFPTDLFYLVGIELGYPNFRQIRVQAEERARSRKQQREHTREISLREIWEQVEEQTGIPCELGMRTEWETEKRCCYANPYMLQVVQELEKMGKRMMILSDMYLGEKYIRILLENCGYGMFENYMVSCDYGKSKSDGGLYQIVRKQLGLCETKGRKRSVCSMVHVGDNRCSDIQRAKEAGLAAVYYPNVNHTGCSFRPEDMSAVTGSIYRGIVNAHIHSGCRRYSREYEFGFIYGGLFAAGYCRFIHAYAKRCGIEKLLFLARDGDVLLQAYRKMYPEDAGQAVYVYWSRLAAVKVTAQYYRYEYLQRFLYHKVNQGYSVRRILKEMELSEVLPQLCRAANVTPETELTNRNIENVREYVTDSWEQIMAVYQQQREAAGVYFRHILKDCRKAAAIDVGWAGSGAWMLECAVRKIWKMDCSVTGILAGTTTGASAEPDMAEPAMMSGQLVSYLYSPQENRDLWKLHDPSQKHNLYWEMLLSAPHGSLKGFYLDENGKAVARFKKSHANEQRIQEIHRGILDFVKLFLETEQRIGFRIPVSGRDAYAPMLSIGSVKNRKFMKELEELLDEIHVG